MAKVRISPDFALPMEEIVQDEMLLTDLEAIHGVDPVALEDIGYVATGTNTSYEVVPEAVARPSIQDLDPELDREWFELRAAAKARIEAVAAQPKSKRPPRTGPTIAEGKRNARKAVAAHRRRVPKQRAPR